MILLKRKYKKEMPHSLFAPRNQVIGLQFVLQRQKSFSKANLAKLQSCTQENAFKFAFRFHQQVKPTAYQMDTRAVVVLILSLVCNKSKNVRGRLYIELRTASFALSQSWVKSGSDVAFAEIISRMQASALEKFSLQVCHLKLSGYMLSK